MIGEALKRIRKGNGWTVQVTADKLGVSKSHVSEIENGKKSPSYELLKSYSKEFDIPLSSLFFFEETLERDGRFSGAARKMLGRAILQLLETDKEKPS
ncbi:MAG: helix-turn-helix transcriptional regulator [Pseudomonadota bacterium]